MENSDNILKLWDKGGGLDNDERALSRQVEAFTVGNDPQIDAAILADDCWASIAHAEALFGAGILDEAELARLREELLRLIVRHESLGVPIARQQEDCHTAIEQALTEELGDLGKKIHTGRSRNDQVLTAVRLMCRRRMLTVGYRLNELILLLVQLSDRNRRLPMRGYSHTQPAMPTTLGAYLAAFAEALSDDGRWLRAAYEQNDACPLGSAAGFGSAIALDRDNTAKLLGFSRSQLSSLYCQNSRGKVEGAVLSALGALQDTLAKLAGDLILFCSREFGFVQLPDALTTGSSIMPQKRNPDVLELVRARAGVVWGAQEQARRLAAGLPSGYNRDFQLLKEPLVRAFDVVEQSLEMMALVLSHARFDAEALAASCTAEIYAADLALQKAQQGVPFRDAYRGALDELEQTPIDRAFVDSRIDAYATLGSMGNLGLDRLERQRQELEGWLDRAVDQHKQALDRLARLDLAHG